MCESQGKRTWTRVDKAHSLKNDAGNDFAWGEARGNAGRSAWWRRRPYFCSGTFSERRHLVPGEAETIAIATVTLHLVEVAGSRDSHPCLFMDSRIRVTQKTPAICCGILCFTHLYTVSLGLECAGVRSNSYAAVHQNGGRCSKDRVV